MKRYVSLRLQVSVLVTLLIIIIVVITSFFIISKEKNALTKILFLRGADLCRSLAIDSKTALVGIGGELALVNFVDDAKKNEGVLYAVIVDTSNNIIASSERKSGLSENAKFIEPSELVVKKDINITLQQGEIIKESSNSFQVSVPIIYSKAGKERKLGIAYLAFSKDELNREIKRAIYNVIYISIVAVVFGVLVMLFAIQVVLEPVKILSKGVEEIGKNNLDYQINVKANNELGQLANTFNQMTQDLKKAQQVLIEKKVWEHELELSKKIQESLIPKEPPKIKGLEIASFWKPAKEVGGDYFDFIPIDDNKLGLIVADVSGKDISGALVMATTRSILRSYAPTSTSPKEVLTKTNQLVCQDVMRGMFITTFYSVFDIENKLIRFANAGHNPLFWYHKETGEYSLFKTKGLSLGLRPEPSFSKALEEKEYKIFTGDIIVQYTDGVTEAKNKEDKNFGEEKMVQIIMNNINSSPREIVDSIVNEIAIHSSGVPQSDDITLVVVKVM